MPWCRVTWPFGAATNTETRWPTETAVEDCGLCLHSANQHTWRDSRRYKWHRTNLLWLHPYINDGVYNECQWTAMSNSWQSSTHNARTHARRCTRHVIDHPTSTGIEANYSLKMTVPKLGRWCRRYFPAVIYLRTTWESSRVVLA